jgi:uncharacterized membrane protein
VTEERLDRIIGRLLQAGVWLSAAVVAIGGVWLLAGSGESLPRYGHFRRPPVALRTPAGVLSSLAHPNPEALVQFGLLLLIATPVARVVLSLVAFAIRRDRVYVAITAVVLAVLAYSLTVS